MASSSFACANVSHANSDVRGHVLERDLTCCVVSGGCLRAGRRACMSAGMSACACTACACCLLYDAPLWRGRRRCGSAHSRNEQNPAMRRHAAGRSMRITHSLTHAHLPGCCMRRVSRCTSGQVERRATPVYGWDTLHHHVHGHVYNICMGYMGCCPFWQSILRQKKRPT